MDRDGYNIMAAYIQNRVYRLVSFSRVQPTHKPERRLYNV